MKASCLHFASDLINTLDEDFRKEMDRAVSIERRLEAMRQFYEAGIQSTCFISPIFPGITDPDRDHRAGQAPVQSRMAGELEPARGLQEAYPQLDP